MTRWVVGEDLWRELLDVEEERDAEEEDLFSRVDAGEYGNAKPWGDSTVTDGDR